MLPRALGEFRFPRPGIPEEQCPEIRIFHAPTDRIDRITNSRVPTVLWAVKTHRHGYRLLVGSIVINEEEIDLEALV